MTAQSDTTKSQSSSQPANLERIKSECSAMIRLLKNLEHEERDLQAQNEILAREVLLCGFEPHLLEPPAPKRRKNMMQKQYLQMSADTADATGSVD